MTYQIFKGSLDKCNLNDWYEIGCISGKVKDDDGFTEMKMLKITF